MEMFPAHPSIQAMHSLIGLALGVEPDPNHRPTSLEEWEELHRLAERHRLHGWLDTYANTDTPEHLRTAWRDLKRVEWARSQIVLRQLDEIANALSEAGIRLIPLKGLAARLWLYPRPEQRAISDLDLLVERKTLSEAQRVLNRLGYKASESRYTSVEQEAIAAINSGHVCPLVKAGYPRVELHYSLFKRRPSVSLWLDEIWRDARPVKGRDNSLWQLNDTHFLIHTCSHYMTDRRNGGSAGAKGLVDVGLLLHARGNQLCWEDLWATAHRWQMAADVATVLSTLQHHWGVEIPELSGRASPLSLAQVVVGEQQIRAQNAWDRCGLELGRCRWLPDFSSRVRYLIQLLIPKPAYMQGRYNLEEHCWLFPHYVRRLLKPFINR